MFGFQVCPVPPTMITRLVFPPRPTFADMRQESGMQATEHQSRHAANYTRALLRNRGKPFNSTIDLSRRRPTSRGLCCPEWRRLLKTEHPRALPPEP
jgi:hypothetical protein